MMLCFILHWEIKGLNDKTFGKWTDSILFVGNIVGRYIVLIWELYAIKKIVHVILVCSVVLVSN